MSNLSKLLGGGGSQGPGDVIPSFGDDAAMLDRGFLPCKGGTLLQADYPDLFAGVGYRENKLVLTPGVTRTATVDAGYFNPCVAYPVVTGSLNILAMMSASTTYQWQSYISIDTGASVGSDTSQAPSDDLRGFRAIGDTLYCGAYNGRAMKRTGATLATDVLFPSTQFPGHSTTTSVLDFWEIGGYLVVGTELGIVRCALADDITNVANWTHVHSRSMTSQALVNGGVNTSNFTYDADTGRLFFRSYGSTYTLYSDDDGATWSEVNVPTSQYSTKVVKWNGAHWIFPGFTPVATTTPTEQQTSVWKSTDGGATWSLTQMRAKGTMQKMQPFVAGDVLYMGWNTTSSRFLIYGYRQEYEGLQEPSDDATTAPIFLAWDSGPDASHLTYTSFHEITGEVFPVGANYSQADGASPIIQTVSFGYDYDTEFALPDLTDQPTPYFIKT